LQKRRNDPRLALDVLAAQNVGADVERAKKMAEPVGAAVGGADPAWLRPRRPRLCRPTAAAD
jgi:hypothetical protein